MDFDDYSFTPNRRVSNIGEDDFYKGPAIDSIPGRIQTLNPYNRDEMTSASFGGFKRRPASAANSGSADCDYYTDSLCLEVSKYPS